MFGNKMKCNHCLKNAIGFLPGPIFVCADHVDGTFVGYAMCVSATCGAYPAYGFHGFYVCCERHKDVLHERNPDACAIVGCRQLATKKKTSRDRMKWCFEHAPIDAKNASDFCFAEVCTGDSSQDHRDCVARTTHPEKSFQDWCQKEQSEFQIRLATGNVRHQHLLVATYVFAMMRMLRDLYTMRKQASVWLNNANVCSNQDIFSHELFAKQAYTGHLMPCFGHVERLATTMLGTPIPGEDVAQACCQIRQTIAQMLSYRQAFYKHDMLHKNRQKTIEDRFNFIVSRNRGLLDRPTTSVGEVTAFSSLPTTTSSAALSIDSVDVSSYLI